MSSKVHPAENSSGATMKMNKKIGPKTRFLTNDDGKELFCSYWKPSCVQTPRALVFLCHGFAEHLQWYEDLAVSLADEGLLAFGHDHVGHGRSGGTRAHVENAEEYVRDVLKHCDIVRADYPLMPCYMVAHSMGGMIAVIAAMKRPSYFAGLVLIGPCIRPDPDQATPLRLFFARIFARFLPYVTVNKLRLDHVTRDSDMKLKLKADPLRYQGGMRARWAITCYDLLQFIEDHMDDVEWPFLILHGTADRLCSLEASQEFHKRAKSRDKKIKIFPEASHNLLIELPEIRKEAKKDTIDWILHHLQGHAMESE